MSGGQACKDKTHRPRYRVLVYRANYSSFNGGRRTPSDYSDLCCDICGVSWRSKAAYVDDIYHRRYA